MENKIYKCKFCNFTASSEKKLFPHAVSHNEHLDISNFITSFSAYYELSSIGLKSLDYFRPFNSKRDISDLVDYLASVSPEYRFSLKECAIVIEDFRLLEHFFKKCIQRNLYPRGSEYITKIAAAIHNLSFPEVQNLIRDLDDVKKRHRIRYTSPEVKTLQDKNSSISKNSKTSSLQSAAKKVKQEAVSDDFLGEAKISEFHFENGKLRYKNLILINKRLCPLTKSIRKSITQTFRIVKDKSLSKRHFKFDSEEDLSVILNACEQANEQRKQTKNNIKLINGTKPIPWSAVTFHDFRLSVLNVFGGSNASFIYRNPHLSRSFNKVIKYIERACPMLTARLRDSNIIDIKGVDKLISLVPKLTNKILFDEEDYDISSNVRQVSLYPGNSYLLNDIKNRKEFSKSAFLSYLSEIHIIDFKVYYLLESVNHMTNECSRDEYGFLFSISQNSRITILVFENVTDESRASIVFTASTPLLMEAINQIKKFLSGDMINKRQKLAYGIVTFKSESIINVTRILHTDIYSWKSNIHRYINQFISI